jgi:hypothetical protein
VGPVGSVIAIEYLERSDSKLAGEPADRAASVDTEAPDASE